MLLGECYLLPELAHRVLLRFRDHSLQRRQDGLTSVLVHDAPVDFPDEFLRVGYAIAQIIHHVLVALRVGVRHIVAQADVAALHDTVELGQLTHNLRVEVEDAAVVLTQLLDAFGRHEAAAHQLLQRTLRYPLRILHVALATWQLLDEVGIHKLQLEVRLKNTPDGNPVHRSTLHRHLRHATNKHVVTHVTQLMC